MLIKYSVIFSGYTWAFPLLYCPTVGGGSNNNLLCLYKLPGQHMSASHLGPPPPSKSTGMYELLIIIFSKAPLPLYIIMWYTLLLSVHIFSLRKVHSTILIITMMQLIQMTAKLISSFPDKIQQPTRYQSEYPPNISKSTHSKANLSSFPSL